MLTTKLEENYDEEKQYVVYNLFNIYQPAGSGSESSSKINEKYLATEPEKLKTINKTSIIDNNSSIQTEKIKTPNNDSSKKIEKKIKEDYKKIVQDKNYSKSIDTNIPKVKKSDNNINDLSKIKINKAKK